MYKNILQTIQDVEIWPIISLVIFFVFFIGILILVFRTDRSFIKRMEHLPLEDATVDNQENV